MAPQCCSCRHSMTRLIGCLTRGARRLLLKQRLRSCPPPTAVGAVSSPKKPFAAIVGGSKVGWVEAALALVGQLLLRGCWIGDTASGHPQAQHI